MTRITKIKAHLTPEELKQKMNQETELWRAKRWEILYTLTVHPRRAGEVARDLGISVSSVHKLVMKYNANGVIALQTPGKGGRRTGNMTLTEEKEFMSAIANSASQGVFVTTSSIKKQYEEKVGHPVHKNTIYQLMERHSWKKKAVRPQHAKTDLAAQEEFKKNFLRKSEI